MTELHFRNTEECINRIKSIKEMYAKDTPSEVALKVAINALEKQIAKKPIPLIDQTFGIIYSFMCPHCNYEGLGNNECRFARCENCGQKLDWSDTD